MRTYKVDTCPTCKGRRRFSGYVGAMIHVSRGRGRVCRKMKENAYERAQKAAGAAK